MMLIFMVVSAVGGNIFVVKYGESEIFSRSIFEWLDELLYSIVFEIYVRLVEEATIVTLFVLTSVDTAAAVLGCSLSNSEVA